MILCTFSVQEKFPIYNIIGQHVKPMVPRFHPTPLVEDHWSEGATVAKNS